MSAAHSQAEARQLTRRIKPSYKTMIETLNQWADDCKDDDEMMHMSINLDDVAAQLANAHEWAEEARGQSAAEGADDAWSTRQDRAMSEVRAFGAGPLPLTA